MPNASGLITNAEVRRMKLMASEGMSQREIALAIGCDQSSVARHIGHMMVGRRDAARRYSQFVALASAYVPTFGGGA